MEGRVSVAYFFLRAQLVVDLVRGECKHENGINLTKSGSILVSRAHTVPTDHVLDKSDLNWVIWAPTLTALELWLH